MDKIGALGFRHAGILRAIVDEVAILAEVLCLRAGSAQHVVPELGALGHVVPFVAHISFEATDAFQGMY